MTRSHRDVLLRKKNVGCCVNFCFITYLKYFSHLEKHINNIALTETKKIFYLIQPSRVPVSSKQRL